jgi:hypothetical protein
VLTSDTLLSLEEASDTNSVQVELSVQILPGRQNPSPQQTLPLGAQNIPHANVSAPQVVVFESLPVLVLLPVLVSLAVLVSLITSDVLLSLEDASGIKLLQVISLIHICPSGQNTGAQLTSDKNKLLSLLTTSATLLASLPESLGSTGGIGKSTSLEPQAVADNNNIVPINVFI